MSKLDWSRKDLKDSDLLVKLYDVRRDSQYEVLDLSYNKLTSLPDLRTFRQFDNLKELYLQRNKISDIDFSLIPPTVRRLDLSHNELTSVGDWSCTKLKYLHVISNKITHVDWGNLPPALIWLDLKKNQLTTVGDLSQYTQLSVLSVAENCISHINWRNLPSALTQLDLCSNKLTKVGDVSQCTRLRKLNVGNNQINHTEWRNLPPALTRLDLRNNQLTTVEDVSQCTGLSELSVQNNEINEIDWRNLPPALTWLNLCNNKFTTVDLMHCTQLVWLDLSVNPGLHSILSLPNKHIDFVGSPNVKVLGRKCFHENTYKMLIGECRPYGWKLEQPPIEVLLQGLEAVLEYYKLESIRTTHTR